MCKSDIYICVYDREDARATLEKTKKKELDGARMRVDFIASTFAGSARDARCELIYRFLGFKITDASLLITSPPSPSLSLRASSGEPRARRRYYSAHTFKPAFSQPTYSRIIKRIYGAFAESLARERARARTHDVVEYRANKATANRENNRRASRSRGENKKKIPRFSSSLCTKALVFSR